METKGNGSRWVDARFVRDRLSVGKTKSYGIIAQIGETSGESDAVLRFGGLVRVREDAFERWIRDHGDASVTKSPPADAPGDGAGADAA